MKELGYGDIVPSFWYGLVVKAGTPRDIVTTLERTIKSALRDPKVSKRFTDQGVVIKISTSTPDDFTVHIDSEIERWGKVTKEAGMTAE
ncbi:MAG: hypothetical protein EOP75_00895 [Variovorax sp.]|nr:MAG: hypothetical protein EOP75_00895 [Variovorax sp.]